MLRTWVGISFKPIAAICSRPSDRALAMRVPRPSSLLPTSKFGRSFTRLCTLLEALPWCFMASLRAALALAMVSRRAADDFGGVDFSEAGDAGGSTAVLARPLASEVNTVRPELAELAVDILRLPPVPGLETGGADFSKASMTDCLCVNGLAVIVLLPRICVSAAFLMVP